MKILPTLFKSLLKILPTLKIILTVHESLLKGLPTKKIFPTLFKSLLEILPTSTIPLLHPNLCWGASQPWKSFQPHLNPYWKSPYIVKGIMKEINQKNYLSPDPKLPPGLQIMNSVYLKRNHKGNQWKKHPQPGPETTPRLESHEILVFQNDL